MDSKTTNNEGRVMSEYQYQFLRADETGFPINELGERVRPVESTQSGVYHGWADPDMALFNATGNYLRKVLLSGVGETDEAGMTTGTKCRTIAGPINASDMLVIWAAECITRAAREIDGPVAEMAKASAKCAKDNSLVWAGEYAEKARRNATTEPEIKLARACEVLALGDDAYHNARGAAYYAASAIAAYHRPSDADASDAMRAEEATYQAEKAVQSEMLKNITREWLG